MLSTRLGELVDAGLVEREVIEGPPIGVLGTPARVAIRSKVCDGSPGV